MKQETYFHSANYLIVSGDEQILCTGVSQDFYRIFLFFAAFHGKLLWLICLNFIESLWKKTLQLDIDESFTPFPLNLGTHRDFFE